MKDSAEQLYAIYKLHPKVCTDTRTIIPDSIFFALKGGSFNANEFAEQALKNGCKYSVIDEEKYKKDERFILVDDVLKSLQELAKYHRSQLKIPFIGITGTNGKTTTKELIKTVLSKKYITLATTGNLNNHIGVPLTILSVTDAVEIAVIEMGANHVGEIAMLCEIAQPDYGIITNIGKAHLEGFGSFEGVIKAKSELYQYIKKTKGKVFVNADNELLSKLLEGIEKITYGTSEKSNCRGEVTEVNPFMKITFSGENIASHLPGRYNAENILCAICVGGFFGVEMKSIKQAIEEYIPSDNRSQLVKKRSNTLLLDAYNANPTSMEASVSNFADMDLPNKVLIIGDMFELGNFSKTEHEKILKLIFQKNFSKILLIGAEFCEAGKNSAYKLFKNSQEAFDWLKKNPIENSTILIKGSRGMKLEKVVEAL